MIPYLPTPAFHIGETRIDMWVIMVCVGILAGIEYTRARAIRRGLSVKVTVDSALVTIVFGFLFAHIVHVVAYNYPTFKENPVTILPWYGGYSSFGGFLGVAIGLPLFLKIKKVPAWAYADNMAHGFLLGWFFGRTGCAFAHDHKGALTDFFLAVDFPGGARHDLGLYEMLFTLFLLITFLLLDRKKDRFHGFYSGLIMVCYAPVRFGFDFLRATDLEVVYGHRSDVRLVGLTPAQYGAIALLALGVTILVMRRKMGQQDTSQEAERDYRRKPTRTEAGEPGKDAEVQADPDRSESKTEQGGQGQRNGEESESGTVRTENGTGQDVNG
ncbi:MAG: prolipoprotein diacylglyceryl transferase [Bradymonadales bacterium]|nr:prolipoprotein diacylglyceryl transferase [Bradymonadales bacterium]